MRNEIVFLSLFALLFSFSAGLLLYHSSLVLADSMNTDGDELPPPDDTPPQEPSCPKMVDNSCKVQEKGRGSDISFAEGQALLFCDGRYIGCVVSQSSEFQQNKEKCEATKGCVLYAKEPINEECSCNESQDCQETEETDDQGNSIWECTAHAEYDITGYICSRPTPDNGKVPA
jgi:hypothetical protein